MRHELLNTTFLQLVNHARMAVFAPPLQLNSTLVHVAQCHAETMALQAYFDHVDRQGGVVGTRLLDAGFNYRYAGENISAGKADIQSVFDWWMSSAGHRANILKPEFTCAGFGYFYIAQDRLSFHHYWVQVFASPL